MGSLSLRIYFTSNILIGVLFLILGGFSGDAFSLCVLAFVVSLMISIPAGFALYFCFLMIDNTDYGIFWRWFCLVIGVFVTALIPYSIACGFLGGDFLSKQTAFPFYLSEGSAFGAILINCVAIHRHFQTPSHEIF